MKLISVDTEAIEQHYAVLNRIGPVDGDPDNGFLRAPYSAAETAAISYIQQVARAAGLNCRFDAVGNLIVATPGSFSAWVETGSHIDTVPGGGNFDGTAGVVAGLAALLAIHSSGTVLQRGLRLRIWRGEESACFGVTSIGSRAAFGRLDASALMHNYAGRSLAEAMLEQGADPELIRAGRPAIDKHERDSIAAFLELHIEQGKVLEACGKDIGIVTAIRGSKRSWVNLHGTFDHSGATPMGPEFRQDANLTMAYIMVRLDQLLRQANSEGADLVQTAGLVNPPQQPGSSLPLGENAITKISGAACFSYEVRGCDAESVESYCDRAFALIRETAEEFGTTVAIETFSDQAGIPNLNPELQKLMTESCMALDLSYTSLPSGAWHDAGTLAQQVRGDGTTIPVGMIFIPCYNGISHSPDERSTPLQIARGASLLATTMIELASI
ncbi:Zn-dependent hydrolase [Mariprofundus sp. KV]|uniref:Zn-dependent hydrolase n=1 Tax=Mariprofundus sp. KV TaxID=2608715 RepID=UPI0015A23C49|nr:Zn-dependent hydrolase [Mariprofundus sp. KV]NWF36299.1 Zn-dependent hydrolase [Mariprofundus sp. KV]